MNISVSGFCKSDSFVLFLCPISLCFLWQSIFTSLLLSAVIHVQRYFNLFTGKSCYLLIFIRCLYFSCLLFYCICYQGFLNHVKLEHNMWSYMYYLIYLNETEPKDYTALDLCVAKQVLRSNILCLNIFNIYMYIYIYN